MTFAFIVFALGAVAVYAGLHDESFADVIKGAVASPITHRVSDTATTAAGGASTGGADIPTGGAWGGSKAVVDVAVQIGGAHGLKVVSTKRSTKMTLSGGVSDHWTGCKTNYAADQSGSPAQMDAAAKEIAQRFGLASWKGVQSVHVNGFRVQLLYRTLVGGNHFNHIHVGARREG